METVKEGKCLICGKVVGIKPCTCQGDFCCEAGKYVVDNVLRKEEKMKPHIYLAAGWFNPEQKRQMDEVYKVLLDLRLKGEIDFFSPMYDGIVLKGKEDPNWRQKMKEVWELDIRKITESDLVIACTQDHDVGTIFECGYASARNIPILCYNSNPELGLNVMLAQEARGFCKTPLHLEAAVVSFIDYKGTLNNEGVGLVNPWHFNLWEGEPI